VNGVSVVIPTYNRSGLVTRAIDSALAQCRSGDEVIVVDDGSTDDTGQRLKSYAGRIVYHRIANGGVGKARNTGMDLAGNPYLAFLDSDDEWLPGKLELQRRLLDARPEVLFCFHDMRGVYPDGSVRPRLTRWYARRDFCDDFLSPRAPYSSIAALPEGTADFPVHIGDLYPEELHHSYVQIGTLMLRRTALLDGTVRAPESVSFTEDVEFIVRLAKRGRAAYLDLELELFHEHAGERLTDLDAYKAHELRLDYLARVWGSDAAFLEKHTGQYRLAVDRERLKGVRILLASGRACEAREELRRLSEPPVFYRLLSWVPAPLLALAARARRGQRR
jgi:glycosyltransferase involved in cell wall biosynthesis